MISAIQPLYSLTQDQSKYKFRQPPAMTDFDEIAEYYVERLSQEDIIDDVLYVLELGLPLENLSKLVVRSAVMEGLHSIENGFLARPIVYEYIKGIADSSDIEYKEKFGNKVESEEKQLKRAASLVKKGLKGRTKDAGFEMLMASVQSTENVEGEMKGSPEEMPAEETMDTSPEQMEMDLGDVQEEQRPAGLMARG